LLPLVRPSKETERHFFEPYVEGNMDDFLKYVAMKRRNAVWGDDPEVQALCELYDRPAEIWSYDSQNGARKLRTFHENSGEGRQRPPMRSIIAGLHAGGVAVFGPQ
jgi:OTU domain-containing protein 5